MNKLFTVLALSAIFLASPNAYTEDMGIPCDPGASSTTLEVGQIFQCSIETPGDSDVYVFSGTAGDDVIVTLSDTGNIFGDMRCEIYHDGGLLTTLVANNTGDREELELIDGQEYSLLCFEAGNDDTDSYNVALQRHSPPPPGSQPLNNDSVIEETINPVADSEAFFFLGAAGSTYVLTLSDVGNIFGDMRADVYGPDQQIVTTLSANNTGTHTTLNLVQSGLYTVVTREAGDDETDSYNIGLQVLFPDALAAEILLYDVNTGNQSISPVADSDVYQFSGTNGDQVVLTLTDVGNIFGDMRADVYDPSESLIVTLVANNTGTDELLNLAETGDYTVRVYESANDETDTYHLNLQCLSGTCFGAPDISAQPTFFNFGEVTVGDSSAPQLFTIFNNGNANLNNISVSSPNAVFAIGNDNCTGAFVEPGNNCTFDVTFSPVVDGLVATRVSVLSNDPDTPDLQLTVAGTGLGVTPEGIVFGSVDGLDTSVVVCTNQTANQTVRILGSLTNYDCGQAGMPINDGDDVQIIIKGTVQLP